MIKPEIVKTLRLLQKPAIIGISGFGGSGKSTLAGFLSERIHAPVVSVDSFYQSGQWTDYRLWEIFDFQRLKDEVIQPFLSGRTQISFGEFDWSKNTMAGPAFILAEHSLIIEGVGLFRPELMHCFTRTVWIDCPIGTAIARGKKRDREEYGLPENPLWDGLWKQNDLQCFKAFSPVGKADFIIKCF